MAYAAGKGVVVVAAAGNYASDVSYFFPAACPGALAITATDVTDQVAGFSNQGTQIALAAPGVDIVADGLGAEWFLSRQWHLLLGAGSLRRGSYPARYSR